MNRSRLIAITLSATFLLAVALPAAASSRHPFRGNWKATDTFDQSNLTYRIVEVARSGGRVFDIDGHDDRTGPWCGGGPASMNAVGVLEGDNSMAVSLVWICLAPSHNVLYFLSDTLTYDPSTNTITDLAGDVFHRDP